MRETDFFRFVKKPHSPQSQQRRYGHYQPHRYGIGKKQGRVFRNEIEGTSCNACPQKQPLITPIVWFLDARTQQEQRQPRQRKTEQHNGFRRKTLQ